MTWNTWTMWMPASAPACTWPWLADLPRAAAGSWRQCAFSRNRWHSEGGEMFCPKCGVENTEGNKYCQKCGAALSVEPPKPTGVCAKCGTQNAEGTKYC